MMLFFRYKTFFLALPVSVISRIVEMPGPSGLAPVFLLDPDNAPICLVLKNNSFLPVSQIQQLTEYQGEFSPANLFLAGCFRKNILAGFASIDNRVYGILSPDFLMGRGEI